MGTGLRWKETVVAVYVLYYCRGHEQLAEPGGWAGLRWKGSCVAVYVLYYFRGPSWLAEPGR